MEAFILALTIFVLAVFVGFEIIVKIPPTLHTPLMSGANAISGITPLMSGANAISGITVVGALVATGAGRGDLATYLGLGALILATINVVGGFLVTHRMLSMFKSKH